jgi:hypothetical protein
MPDDAQHIELLECCLSLKGHVIISGLDHPVYNRMLASWHRREVRSRTASHDLVTTEVLWISPQRLQPTLFQL